MVDLHFMRNPSQVTSFHIAGDNGVGKSFIASLFSKAFFLSPTDGLLYLSGGDFIGSSPSLVRKYRDVIRKTMISQLSHCPESLIIFDDVQYIHSQTLLVLQQFMDNGNPFIVDDDGGKVDKSHAIIGLISDFGDEGVSYGLESFEELEEMVERHTAELWDFDPKQSQLIQWTFPFSSLSDEHLESIANHTLSNLPHTLMFHPPLSRVAVTKGALSYIRNKVRDIYPLENGRGVSKWIEKRCLPQLTKSITEQVDTQRKRNIEDDEYVEDGDHYHEKAPKLPGIEVLIGVKQGFLGGSQLTFELIL